MQMVKSDNKVPCAQGPNAPWCVGSVISPPQLLTSDLGPLLFNPLGRPQCLLCTGHQVSEQFRTAISTNKQTADFVLRSSIPYIPRDLLQNHLQLDRSLNEADHIQGNLFQGNKLQALKSSDGSILILFVCGEHSNKIGSTVYYTGASGKWFPVQTSQSSNACGDFEQTQWSVSTSLHSPIRQLSAIWAHWSDNVGEGAALVAAVTLYQVCFCTISREGGRVQFISTAFAKFQVPVAHVTWNPHVNGEAAVILESGVVCLFDVEASGNGNPNSVVDLAAKVTLEYHLQRLSAKSLTQDSMEPVIDRDQLRPSKGMGIERVSSDALELIELRQKWWRCEFGWLPQTLLVANCQEIFLLDVRKEQNGNDPSSGSCAGEDLSAQKYMVDIDIVATVEASNSFSLFCSFKSSKENILAFARADYSGIYEFTLATEQHLMLFDIRQPQTPILQWEHGMRLEPPGHLIMCPLSSLRSYVDDKQLKNVQNGKVILAASLKSGDIRVFCYGSEVLKLSPVLGKNPKKQKVEHHDWNDAAYALDMPSRLYAPQADLEDWKDILCSSQGLFARKNKGLFRMKSTEGQRNIMGIVLLSENSLEPTLNNNNKTFNILQLTGSGKILAQTYEASHQLRCPLQGKVSNTGDIFDFEQSIKFQEPKYELLPAFLNYIHTGSVLAPSHSSNFEERQESIIADQTEGARDCHDGQNSEAISTQNQATLDAPVSSNRVLEDSKCRAAYKTLLKAFVSNLNIPLSIYDVAHKVLAMGLPERLAPLALGMPSDLKAARHRGNKFPLISTLLQSTAPFHESADPRRKDESLDHTFSSNEMISKVGLQGTIPLPLLLEIHNIQEPLVDPSSTKKCGTKTDPHEDGNSVRAQDLSNFDKCNGSEDVLYNEVTIENGQELILQGCQILEDLIEGLVAKREPRIISLSEPTQDWPDNLNVDGDSDCQILLYHLLEQGGFPIASDIEDHSHKKSLVDDGTRHTINRMKFSQTFDIHNMQKKSGAFSKDMYSKFLARKSGSKTSETNQGKQNLEIHPDICPVNLCFTAPEEELEDVELTALKDMENDFDLWQQSFAPYRSSY